MRCKYDYNDFPSLQYITGSMPDGQIEQFKLYFFHLVLMYLALAVFSALLLQIEDSTFIVEAVDKTTVKDIASIGEVVRNGLFTVCRRILFKVIKGWSSGYPTFVLPFAKTGIVEFRESFRTNKKVQLTPAEFWNMYKTFK